MKAAFSHSQCVYYAASPTILAILLKCAVAYYQLSTMFVYGVCLCVWPSPVE